MNVLSLFDGISCGYLALKRAGIPITSYYASEIDKHSILCSHTNHPNIIHIGDINNISYKNGCLITPSGSIPVVFDLVIGGSPCQSFSAAGDQSGFKGKSGLYWEFSRLLKEINPTYFLLENVVMKSEWQAIIDTDLNVTPILIDSALVSYQRRKRLYWTNIPNIQQPLDKNLHLSSYFDPSHILPKVTSAQMVGRRLNSDGKRDDYNKSIPTQQYIEIRHTDKCNTLTTVLKDNIVTILRSDDPLNINGRIPVSKLSKTSTSWRYLTPEEYEIFQTLPPSYTKMLSKTQRYKSIGNSWTVDVIAHIFTNLKGNNNNDKPPNT